MIKVTKLQEIKRQNGTTQYMIYLPFEYVEFLKLTKGCGLILKIDGDKLTIQKENNEPEHLPGMA